MYRENYCQRKAIEMYALGKTQAEVIQMLLSEQANEITVVSLAEKFYQDFLFLRKEKGKQKRKKAERDILIGSVFSAGGIVITLLSYLFLSGGSFVLHYGLILIGLIFLGRGLIEKRNLNK